MSIWRGKTRSRPARSGSDEAYIGEAWWDLKAKKTGFAILFSPASRPPANKGPRLNFPVGKTINAGADFTQGSAGGKNFF
jgi:hypothetical protein